MGAFSAIVGDCQFFSREEELQLVRRWQELGDQAAREALFRSLFPLMIQRVLVFCRRYRRRDLDAFESVAAEGVLKAIDKFDPSRGYRLSTYATRAAWTHMQKNLCELVVRLPQNYYKQDTYQAEVTQALAVSKLPEVEFGDLVTRDHSPDESIDFSPDVVSGALALLTQCEQLVIRARYFEGQTLKAVGETLGVTRERVRQIEVLALSRLRQVLEPAA